MVCFCIFRGLPQRFFFELPDEVMRAVETNKFTSFAILVKDVKYLLSFLSDNHEQVVFDENNKDKYAVLRAIGYINVFDSDFSIFITSTRVNLINLWYNHKRAY